MPIPVNNQAAPGPLLLDQKLVAAGFLKVTNSPVDLANDFDGSFTVQLDRQDTSTVIVKRKPSLDLADTPADRDGLLARTGITAGGSVEVGFTADKYFKVAVDQLGVKPGETAQAIGEAGGEALIKVSSADIIATLAAGGTTDAREYTGTEYTADDVWNALVAQNTAFVEGEIGTDNLVTYVSGAAWGKLVEGRSTLAVAVDPREQAKTLLGIGKLRVLNLPAGVIAIVSHPVALAPARVLDRLSQGVEDFDTVVRGRIKLGSKVIAPEAVRVVTLTEAPVA